MDLHRFKGSFIEFAGAVLIRLPCINPAGDQSTGVPSLDCARAPLIRGEAY
jgi:hypothetical protein